MDKAELKEWGKENLKDLLAIRDVESRKAGHRNVVSYPFTKDGKKGTLTINLIGTGDYFEKRSERGKQSNTEVIKL